MEIEKDTVTLVLATNDKWETCCITQSNKDGKWLCGLNYITTPAEALETAEQNNLNIVFEKNLKKGVK